MDTDEIKRQAEEMAPWYHAIQLLPDYTTRSVMSGVAHQWDAVRTLRDDPIAGVDYRGKSVLDVGTMDGMWAFEAEARGATTVIAVDTYQGNWLPPYHRFMLARHALRSRAVMQCADAHNLWEDTRIVRRAASCEEGVDIIQALGLLYHLEAPLVALKQFRRCLKPGGTLLLETAMWWGTVGLEPVWRSNTDGGVYWDENTFFAPNKAALLTALDWAGFRLGRVKWVDEQLRVGRAVLTAVAS